MRIDVELGKMNELDAELGAARISITEGEDYTGPYEVTPDFAAQTLPTKAKTMTDDVTVKSIPVYRVDNAAGGRTVTIGDIKED